MNTNKTMMVIAIMFFAITTGAYAITQAGTVISNTAFGNYDDANGNAMPQVSSNTVETTVTQVAGVSVGPDGNTVFLPSMGSVYVPLTVTNTGNGDDTYNLTTVLGQTGSSSYTREIWSDLDGDGIIEPGDVQTSVTPLMSFGSTYDIIIKITDTGVGVDGDIVTVDVTGTSQFNAGVSDLSDITATIQAPDITVVPGVDNPGPAPDDLVTYEYCLTNDGSITANDVTFVAPIPANTTYSAGSIVLGNGTQTDISDVDSSDYNVTNVGDVTIFLGEIAPNGSICVYFTVSVNTGVPPGTPIDDNPEITYKDSSGTPYPPLYPTIPVTVGSIFSITVNPDSVTTGNPSDEMVFIVTVANLGNTSDIINMTFTDAWTWVLYLDEGNGTFEGTESVLIDNNSDTFVDVGSVGAAGTVTVFAVATIPPGTADGNVHAFTLVGTSVGNGSVTDQAVFTITTTAPFITLLKSVSPQGDQPPGTTLTYSVLVNNTGSGGATSVIVTDAIPTTTTYVGGSLTVNAFTKTDAADADEAACDGTTATFNLNQLVSVGSSTVTFQVVIN